MSGKRRKGGQKKKQEKHKKTPRKFAYLRISCYLCTRKTETGTMPNVKFHSTLHDKPFLFVRKSTRKTETDTLTTVSCDAIGRLAQLVQSVCLTSRGSGVRIPQRPPGVFPVISSEVAGIFFCYSPCPVFSAKLCRTLHPRIRNASHQCPLDINGWRHFICTKLRAQCQAGARRSNVMRMSRLAV